MAKTPPKLPPLEPGWRLCEHLKQIAKGDPPAFHLNGGERVPMLTFTAEWVRYQSTPEALVRPETSLYIDTGHNAAVEDLVRTPSAYKEVRRLTAAAALDLGRTGRDVICEGLGLSDDRAVGRDVARGRRLWVTLGAWPWWAIAAAFADGEDGPWDFQQGMPDRWWELPRVVATFEAWRTGSQKPLREHARRAA